MRGSLALVGLLALAGLGVAWVASSGAAPAPAAVAAASRPEASKAVPAIAPAERIAVAAPSAEAIAERVARAPTVKDAIRALGLEPGVELDAETRAYMTRWLSSHRDQSVRDLADHRASPPAGNAASVRLRELKLEEGVLRAELAWRAFCAGDYFVGGGDIETRPLVEQFETHGYSGGFPTPMTIVLRRDPEFRRLARAQQIETFNAQPEAQRRRLLALRDKDLADPDADRRWLRDHFPEGCAVDLVAATIR